MGIPLTNDEYSMVFSNHFGLHFRGKGKSSAPENDYALILTCAIQCSFAFIFSMLACIAPFPLTLLCGICVVLILFFRVLTTGVFFWAVIAGRYTRRFYATSVVFWGWWPCWLLLLSFTSTVLGLLIGNYFWSQLLGPYYELKGLQMYKDINPHNIPGERVQDAGLVDFTQFVEPDRNKGGCFMDKGNTYCISPIVLNGEVTNGLASAPRTGSYDYFAVGINCCSCPNRDFQCGDWRNPLADGGIRSLDHKSRPQYNLALDDWRASYGKTAKHPLFFEWVQGPEWVWKGMWNRFLQLFWLSVAAAFSIGLSIGFLLDKFQQVLWAHDVITPRAVFAPGPGAEYLTLLLLPKMFLRYNEEQGEIADMPVGDEWREQRGPGSAGDDKALAQEYGAMSGGNRMAMGAMNSVLAPPGSTMGGGGMRGAAFY